MENKNNMEYLFEDFLKDKHIKENPEILDDDLPDHFDNWITELQVDDIIGYGNQAMQMLATTIIKKYD